MKEYNKYPMQLKEVISFPLKDINSKLIAQSDNFNVNAIILKKGAIIKEHITLVPAFLLVKKGHITINYQKEKIPLKAGEFITIRPNDIHWVEAKIESEFLLIK